MMRNELPQLMTVDDVVLQYNIRKSTLYAMVARRELPSVKIGKRVYFRRADLDTYVESKVRTSKISAGESASNNDNV